MVWLARGGLPVWIAIAAAVVVIAAAVGWLVVAAHRRRSAGRRADTPPGAAVRATLPDVDLDLLVTGAVTHGPSGSEPAALGSVAGDPHPAGAATPAGRPVWVRRLDQRIPVMPTHRNVPIDHEEAARVAWRDTDG